MFVYDIDKLKDVLMDIVQRNISKEAWYWLKETLVEAEQNAENGKHFSIAFVVMPRKVGKAILKLQNTTEDDIRSIRHGVSISDWSSDRLCRVLLLLHLPASDKHPYVATIEKLFSNAEMNEMVSLYSALPLLAYPEAWRKRCADGIRSNIGIVLESIMCNNPYPAEQLDESAWNQLVLKAIFTDKPLQQVIGLQDRANQCLADALTAYAEERWAAHRTVNPLLWQCVGKFINERIFTSVKRLSLSPELNEQESVALMCSESTYLPAKELVNQYTDKRKEIARGEVSWHIIAQRTKQV